MNGQNFENIQLSKAMEILRNNTHLSITVKTNLFGKYEGGLLMSEDKFSYLKCYPFDSLCRMSMMYLLTFLYALPFCTVFKELLTRLSEEKRNGAPHLPKIGDIKKASRYSIPDLAVDVEQVIGLEKVTKKSKANTVGGRNKLKKILDKTRISILPQKPYK